ncbi:acyl-CoA dehydrogenase [Granulosicoccaceae sp. 1_MG-2023]|nr:acyl-CoA dehydrogenase [Granulosicoccaceae sp. 1_MG-2023]
MMTILSCLLALLAALWLLASFGPGLFLSILAIGGVLSVFSLTGVLGGSVAVVVWLLFLAGMLVFAITPLRHRLISKPLLGYVRAVLPPMSGTERTAIEAGTVWWEGELFRGKPDWQQLLSTPEARLSAEEQAFIDGPTETLCAMLDDWQITHELNDLPEHVWQYMKEQRFFGMVIPREYGGLGFSAMGHSEVVTKLSARSVTGGVTVMVPNSLGPAELLMHYGTEAQKDYYLPRLAVGEEIPCFALTGPTAGSDAAAMPDTGIVCKGEFEGREVLGLRVSWEKRYITLGPVATVLGLAFRAYDPDGLLGGEEDLGITCALIPTSTPGVNIGRRHYPLNQAFMNGPNSGKDVFVPMDWVIGGQEMVGQGWRMLMESLSAGRGISLPSNGVASGKFAARMTGAYARVRKQFNLPIGKFEGVEEALTRIAGLTYMMDAGRRLTCAALDQGEKPSVVSAMLKYHNTEGMRKVINDAMDVHGGKGICMGPGNYLGRAYQGVPVGITVEGANILTRSMIIFGQGAMRCHPWLVREIEAASLEDAKAALVQFDDALMRHLSYTTGNGARALWHGLTRGYFAASPVDDESAKYYRRLARMSAAYAFLADFALLFLGGGLKRREKLSGRFADGLTYMYICSAVLKRYQDTGRPEADRALMEWSARYCLYEIQVALDQILRNFPSTATGLFLRAVIFPLGRRYRTPNDQLGHRVAQVILEPGEARDRLTGGLYVTTDPDDAAGRVEDAFLKVVEAGPVEKKLRALNFRPGPTEDAGAALTALVTEGRLTQEEADCYRLAQEAVRRVIMVDDHPGRRG